MILPGYPKAPWSGFPSGEPEMQIGVMKQVLDRMIRDFRRNLDLAKTLNSPNPEDSTEAIKCAIVGFSVYSAIENWERSHYEYVNSRLTEVPGMFEGQVRLLQAMCLGGIVGQAYERKVNELEFQLADMQMPGYLMTLPHDRDGNWVPK